MTDEERLQSWNPMVFHYHDEYFNSYNKCPAELRDIAFHVTGRVVSRAFKRCQDFDLGTMVKVTIRLKRKTF
jgi:hypothetical protein